MSQFIDIYESIFYPFVSLSCVPQILPSVQPSTLSSVHCVLEVGKLSLRLTGIMYWEVFLVSCGSKKRGGKHKICHSTCSGLPIQGPAWKFANFCFLSRSVPGNSHILWKKNISTFNNLKVEKQHRGALEFSYFKNGGTFRYIREARFSSFQGCLT